MRRSWARNSNLKHTKRYGLKPNTLIYFKRKRNNSHFLKVCFSFSFISLLLFRCFLYLSSFQSYFIFSQLSFIFSFRLVGHIPNFHGEMKKLWVRAVGSQPKATRYAVVPRFGYTAPDRKTAFHPAIRVT